MIAVFRCPFCDGEEGLIFTPNLRQPVSCLVCKESKPSNEVVARREELRTWMEDWVRKSKEREATREELKNLTLDNWRKNHETKR